MEQGSDLTGDVADLNQEDGYTPVPIPPVRVNVDGPVQTHDLPAVSGGSRSYAVAALDQPKRVANEDPRRKVVRITADQAFYVGETANEVASRYAAKWPANTVCTITHMEAVYVGVLVDGTVSVMTENWAN